MDAARMPGMFSEGFAYAYDVEELNCVAGCVAVAADGAAGDAGGAGGGGSAAWRR